MHDLRGELLLNIYSRFIESCMQFMSEKMKENIQCSFYDQPALQSIATNEYAPIPLLALALALGDYRCRCWAKDHRGNGPLDAERYFFFW